MALMCYWHDIYNWIQKSVGPWAMPKSNPKTQTFIKRFECYLFSFFKGIDTYISCVMKSTQLLFSSFFGFHELQLYCTAIDERCWSGIDYLNGTIRYYISPSLLRSVRLCITWTHVVEWDNKFFHSWTATLGHPPLEVIRFCLELLSL